MESNTSPTPLTSAAAFWLIATLMLGGVFQPASGSFVLGPTSRYWRCSPISSAFEVWMIWRRIFQAVPPIIKQSYEIATHPDARLTDIRRTHGKGREADDASGLEGSPNLGANSEDSIDIVEVDLADSAYELIGVSEGVANVSRDEEVGKIQEARIFERFRSFIFMWLAMMKMLAYCIITSRAMNAPSGSQRYRELYDIRDDITKRHEFYQSIVHEMNEGWRFRLGVCLPILAQFTKIMMVQGITLPKILAVLYFGHWLLLELLLTLASNCCYDARGLVMNVDTYLSESYQSFENNEWATADARPASLGENANPHFGIHEPGTIVSEAATDDDVAEIQRRFERWPFDQWENDLLSVHMVLALYLAYVLAHLSRFDVLGSAVTWEKGLLAAALAFASFLYFPCFRKHTLIKGRSGGIIRSKKRTKFDHRQFRRHDNDPTFGGYVIGGELGLISLGWWLFYCITIYDSKSTNRPSWPWLDILG